MTRRSLDDLGGFSAGALDPFLVPRTERLTQLALADLARLVARQLAADLDRPRLLVVGEMLLDEPRDLGRLERVARFGLHDGVHRLAPLFVRDSDHRHVPYLGMRVDHVL